MGTLGSSGMALRQLSMISLLLLGAMLPCSEAANYTHGVALGGLFVMETTWMYDQFSAPSENDWVRHLRNGSDAAAISTMRNHWESYVTPSMIDELASRGIDRVRVP